MAVARSPKRRERRHEISSITIERPLVGLQMEKAWNFLVMCSSFIKSSCLYFKDSMIVFQPRFSFMSADGKQSVTLGANLEGACASPSVNVETDASSQLIRSYYCILFQFANVGW